MVPLPGDESSRHHPAYVACSSKPAAYSLISTPQKVMTAEGAQFEVDDFLASPFPKKLGALKVPIAPQGDVPLVVEG